MKMESTHLVQFIGLEIDRAIIVFQEIIHVVKPHNL